jgi:asparagine N-glycosylation enzyme membrane subunit Stt3
MKKIIIILIFIGLISPFFSFSQTTPPGTLEEVKETGEKALEVGEKELPGIIGQIWENEILPVWLNMWNWLKAKTWSKIEVWITPEYEKRKQYFEEGFEEEKEELKEELKTEVPKVSKSLWEKFKELIK